MRKNLILLVLLLAVCAGGYFITLAATDSMDNYKSAFIDKNFTNSAPSQKTVDKVYFIIIDGLRYDQVESGNMPFLKGLVANKKASLSQVENNVPSYTRPIMVNHTTGATSEISGFTMNEQHKALEIPSIFELAGKQGLKTAASTQYWYDEMLNKELPYPGPAEKWINSKSLPIQRAFFYTDDYEKDSIVYSAASQIVKEYNPQLMLIQSLAVDQAGHDYGADSPQYRAAVKNVDSLIKNFYESVPEKDSAVFFITSDHGHRDIGGHGGYEDDVRHVPLILTGKGVIPGYKDAEISQSDLAPTISALLGLPFTPYMQGSILNEYFTFDRKLMSDKKLLLLSEQRQFLKTFGRVTNTTPAIPDNSQQDNSSLMNNYMQETKSQALKDGYFERLIIVHLIFFLSLIGYFKFFKPARGFIINYKVPALVYFITFNIFYYLQKYAYSYSGIPEKPQFISHIGGTAVVSFLIAVIAQKIITRKKPTDHSINPVLHLSFSILTGLLWITLYAYTQVGLKIGLFLPDLDLFVLLFVTTFQITVVAGTAFIYGVASSFFTLFKSEYEKRRVIVQ